MNRTTLRSLPGACALVCAALFLVPEPAHGVIIDSSTGTGNTTAPADNPGWANVGTVANGSAVYLGNRWVLTASHVWSGPTTFSGTTYQIVPGSEITLSNNGAAGRSALTDLVLYQLATDPGLPAVTIAGTTPAAGSAVTMIGAGRDRGAFTQWNVNTSVNPYTWTVTGSNGNAAGYQWAASRTMRWGTNNTGSSQWIDYTIDNLKSAYTFDTTFNYLPYYSNEAQAAAGDSGGAVFHKNGSTWELAGVMLVTAPYSGQPANTAVYGNLTYSADLSYYRSQIVQVVPEPSAIVIAGLGGLTFAATAIRRRIRRA